MVSHITADNPRPYYGPVALLLDGEWRINNNIQWLLSKDSIFVLLSTFGFLPLFWIALRKNIPPQLRALESVSMLYFSLLLFIGNIYEARVFGELVVILYIPAAIGLSYSLTGPRHIIANGFSENNVSKYICRYAPALILTTTAATYTLLNNYGTQHFYPHLH